MAKKAARVIDKKTTDQQIEERIRRKTEASITHHALAGEEAIDQRLEQLDREWDIDRCIQLNVGLFSLLSIIRGATGRRRWYLGSFLGSICLVQQAVQGWSPPATLLRRLGIRTREEIDFERYALKILRGDFEELKILEVKDQQSTIHDTLEAVRR